MFGLKPSSTEYAYLKANQEKGLPQILREYEKKFLSSDSSPRSLKTMAIIATLTNDYHMAMERYKGYLQTLSTQEAEKERVTNELLRLEGILQGKEILRTAA
jgi:hypothetical protein